MTTRTNTTIYAAIPKCRYCGLEGHSAHCAVCHRGITKRCLSCEPITQPSLPSTDDAVDEQKLLKEIEKRWPTSPDFHPGFYYTGYAPEPEPLSITMPAPHV